MAPNGDPNVSLWGAKGHKNGAQIDKSGEENAPRIEAPKKYRKSAEQRPPGPPKVGFRSRGASILINPAIHKKSPKSQQKCSGNDTKTEPEGQKGPSKTLEKPHKKTNTEKDLKKTQNEPVLAREREARLNEEPCPSICSKVGKDA